MTGIGSHRDILLQSWLKESPWPVLLPQQEQICLKNHVSSLN